MMSLRAHRDLVAPPFPVLTGQVSSLLRTNRTRHVPRQVDGWKFPIHEAAGYVGRQLWASVVAALLIYVPVAAVVLVSPPSLLQRWTARPQAARAQPPGQCSWHARRSRVPADRSPLAVHAKVFDADAKRCDLSSL